MPSPSSKFSASKTSPRSPSHTRLVATKTAKPQKVAAGSKARTNPPPSLQKSSRWPKGKAASVSPPPAGGTRAAAPAEDRTSRSGLSKTELKAQFAKLSAAVAQINALKRSLNKSFYDIGVLLNQVRDERMYEVKGYGSMESFVEREIDLNKAVCLKTARIAEVILRDQALAAGLDRAAAAVAALDGETESSPLLRPAGSPAGGVPLHKQ